MISQLSDDVEVLPQRFSELFLIIAKSISEKV
jgi:hypothetical protein